MNDKHLKNKKLFKINPKNIPESPKNKTGNASIKTSFIEKSLGIVFLFILFFIIYLYL